MVKMEYIPSNLAIRQGFHCHCHNSPVKVTNQICLCTKNKKYILKEILFVGFVNNKKEVEFSFVRIFNIINSDFNLVYTTTGADKPTEPDRMDRNFKDCCEQRCT